MTATDVLLRSAVRICAADAAALEFGSRVYAAGIAEGAARELITALAGGGALPDGFALVASVAIPSTMNEPAAKLLLFVRAPRVPGAPAYDALAAIAAEIGFHFDSLAEHEPGPLAVTSESGVRGLAAGLDAINDAAVILDWPAEPAAARFSYVNAAFETLFLYRADQTIGLTIEMFTGPLTDWERIESLFHRLKTMPQARNTVVCYRSDGVPMWIELNVRRVDGSSGGNPFIVATLHDATTRIEFERAIAKEKRKLQVTLAAIGDGVITTVADGRIDFVNSAARSLFGLDAAETYGEPIGEALQLTDTQGAVLDVLRLREDRHAIVRGQALFGRGRTIKHIAYVTSPIADEGYVVVLRDITAQHRLATQLSYEASHDPLTSIYNRRKFDELLGDAVESAARGEGPHALAFLDLDRFKTINDACGHATGDRVLVELAHLLQQQLRGRDVLARIGGDEFAVLLHECTLDNARRVLDKLRAAVGGYGVIAHGNEYGVGVSIGVAPIDGSEPDAAEIVRRADVACYAAKNRGRNAIAG